MDLFETPWMTGERIRKYLAEGKRAIALLEELSRKARR